MVPDPQLDLILFPGVNGKSSSCARQRHHSELRAGDALTLNAVSPPWVEMNSSIFFRTRFLISGRAVMQELEIGVILEMYLFLLQSQTESREDHHIPGLGDPRLLDNIQVFEHEFDRLHGWFTRNKNHFELIRWDRATEIYRTAWCIRLTVRFSSVSVQGPKHFSGENTPTKPLLFPRPFDPRKFFRNLRLKVLTVFSFVALVRFIGFLAVVRSTLRPNIRGDLGSCREHTDPPAVDGYTDRLQYLINFSDRLFLLPFRTGNPDARPTHDRFCPDRGAVLR